MWWMVVGEAWVLRLLVSCDGINLVAWLGVDWQRGGTIKQWQSMPFVLLWKRYSL